MGMVLFASMLVPSVFTNENIYVKLNGNDIQFDVPPQIIKDRTMVPMRSIFEELGYIVKWFSDSKTIKANGNQGVITMQVGKQYVYKNDVATYIDVSPLIISDRTLIPLRAVSEILECNVLWDGHYTTVYISNDNHVHSENEAIAMVREEVENGKSMFVGILPYEERWNIDYKISTEFYFDVCYIVHASTTTIDPGRTGSFKVYKNGRKVEYLGLYVVIDYDRLGGTIDEYYEKNL